MRLATLSALALLVAAPLAMADQQLSFDGMDDRVTVPYDASFPTQVFSISAWIRTLPPSRRAAVIARGEDDDSFNLSWQLYVHPNGTLQIMLENSSEQNFCYPVTCMGQPEPSCILNGDPFVADDMWRHVAATRDAAGSLRLYVDGAEVAVCQGTGVPSSNNFQDLTIGCTHGTIGPPPGGEEPPTWFFPGVIDDPAMWNVALTLSEIQDVHANGVSPTAPGLMGYWSFDEGSGQIVADLSPAANHGFRGADSVADSADPQWVDLAPAGAPGEASPPAVTADQMQASYDTAGGTIEITYRPACDAGNHTIYYGPLADVSVYGYSGAECLSGGSGSATFDPGLDDAFFLVVGRNNTEEGSYGQSTAGERPEDFSTAGCDRLQNLAGVTCE